MADAKRNKWPPYAKFPGSASNTSQLPRSQPNRKQSCPARHQPTHQAAHCSERLEVDASRELQLSLRLLAGSVDRAEAVRSWAGRVGAVCIRNTIVNVGIRIDECGVIEEVVRLGAKLELYPLRDREILEDAEVHCGVTGAVELVATHIPCASVDQVPVHRDRRWRSEGPAKVGETVRNRRTAHKSPGHMLECEHVRAVINTGIIDAACVDVEGCPTQERDDRIGLPSAHHLVHKPRDVGSVLLTMAKRKVVHPRCDKRLTLVLIGVPVVEQEGGSSRRDEEPSSSAVGSGVEGAIRVIQRARVRIRAGHHEVIAYSAVERNLQTVVMPRAPSNTLVDRLTIGIGR